MRAKSYQDLRNNHINFTTNTAELEVIHEKMLKAGMNNRAAYIRKMALTGHIIQLDLEPLRKTAALLAATSNNINQIAKRVNGGGSLYQEDINDMRQGYDELRGMVAGIYDELQKLTEGLS